MIPGTAELKRIHLAFESLQPEELRQALNSLLIFSCQKQSIGGLSQSPSLWDHFFEYFDKTSKGYLE